MIKAEVKLENSSYKSFKCSGHAGFAAKGSDVVCAAVSILVINTANAIELLSESDFCSECKDNEISFEFNDTPDEKGKVLMDALILGLENIQKEYGKKYLKLVIS